MPANSTTAPDEFGQMVADAYAWAAREKVRRRFGRPAPPNRKLPPDSVLRHLYLDLNWSATKIAVHYKCTESSVSQMLKRIGVKTRPRAYRRTA